MKTIALVRVSTQHQDLDSQSLTLKEEMYRDGWTDEDIILIEDKESGLKSEEERNGLNELKRYINQGNIKSVYVYELTRIARKEKILYSIKEFLELNHVELICLKPYFRLSDPNSTMFFSIFTGMAAQENYLRTERTLRGKARKKKEGKLTSGKPLFGYTLLPDKTIIPDKEKSERVKYIYNKFIEGYSMGYIAREMYKLNVFNTNKINTITCNIDHILKDERYTGSAQYPAIISIDTFDKAAETRATQKKYFSRITDNKGEYLLQGLLYTTDNYALTPSIGNNRYCKQNDPDTISLSINIKYTDRLALYVLKEFLSVEGNEMKRKEEIEQISKDLCEFEKICANLKEKICKLKEISKRQKDLYINGLITITELKEMSSKTDKETAKLEEEIQTYEYRKYTFNNRLIYLNSFSFNELYTMDDLEKLSVQDKRNMMKNNIEKIIVKRIEKGHYMFDFKFKGSGKEYIYYYKSTSRYNTTYFDKNGLKIL